MLKKTMRIATNHRLAAGFIAGSVFFIYFLSMGRYVTFIDCGELAAVCATTGIAHPTGYPLFTLLGRIFCFIPIDPRILLRLNLLSTIFSAGAVFCFYFIIHHLINSELSGSLQKKIQPSIMLFALAGSLLLGFSRTFWSQAVIIEVYSLHTLFITLVILLLLKSFKSFYINRFDILLAYVFGLSFSNHMTTILLVPATIYLYFFRWNRSKKDKKFLLHTCMLLVPFLLGLSIYLYLPIRASQPILLNWGDPDNWFNFINHISGKQYRVWMTFSGETATKQLTHFFELLPGEMALIPLLIAPLGMWFMWRNMKNTFITTFILFITCIAYSINYDIHDIDSYFLLAFMITTLWATFGLVKIYLYLYHKPRHIHLIFATVTLTVAVIPLFWHISKINQNSNTFVRNYTQNMLHAIEDNGVVLSYQWDYFVAPFLYLQHVERRRPDIALIDKELLRRSWYFEMIEKIVPKLTRDTRAEIDAFLKELYKFEHDLPYDPGIIQTRFERMILKFIQVAMSYGRPVYVTHEIEPEFTKGYVRIPHGPLYRLGLKEEFIPAPEPGGYWTHDFRPGNFRANTWTEKGRFFTREMFFLTGLYLMNYQQDEAARDYFRLVLEIDPNHATAEQELEKINSQ